MLYIIEVPHYTNQPNFYNQSEEPPAQVNWTPDLNYGAHLTNVDAKRAYMTACRDIDANTRYTDDDVKIRWSIARNQQLARVASIDPVKYAAMTNDPDAPGLVARAIHTARTASEFEKHSEQENADELRRRARVLLGRVKPR